MRIAIHYHIEAEDDEVENVEHHHRTHLGHPALLGLVVMWILCGGEKLELLDQIGAEDDGVESDKSALKCFDHYHDYEDDEGKMMRVIKVVWKDPMNWQRVKKIGGRLVDGRETQKDLDFDHRLRPTMITLTSRLQKI